MSMCNKSIQMH